MKKRIFLFFITIMLLFSFSMTVSAGFQKMPNGKYRYYVTRNRYIKGKRNENVLTPALKNLTVKGKKYTYAFDEKGYMLTGWQVLNTRDSSGVYTQGCYYFNKNGRMLKNTAKGGSYFLGNGRLVNAYDKYGNYYDMNGKVTEPPKSSAGWENKKKGTKYRISQGNYATKTWMCIRDKSTGKANWYYFRSNGYLAKNTFVGNHYVDAKVRWIPQRDK